MSDPNRKVIYLDDAIDAVSKACYEFRGIFGDCEDALLALPPAQPEIIRCNKCKHGVHTGCGNIYLCVVSPENRLEHRYDFWCAYAERRTDERTT